MALQAGQVARMLRDSSWSRAEIEAWAACKPLVDRAYLRRGLYLGDGAWEELFDALTDPAPGAAGLAYGAPAGGGAQRPGPDRRGARWRPLRPPRPARPVPAGRDAFLAEVARV